MVGNWIDMKKLVAINAVEPDVAARRRSNHAQRHIDRRKQHEQLRQAGTLDISNVPTKRPAKNRTSDQNRKSEADLSDVPGKLCCV